MPTTDEETAQRLKWEWKRKNEMLLSSMHCWLILEYSTDSHTDFLKNFTIKTATTEN